MLDGVVLIIRYGASFLIVLEVTLANANSYAIGMQREDSPLSPGYLNRVP